MFDVMLTVQLGAGIRQFWFVAIIGIEYGEVIQQLGFGDGTELELSAGK